ncbi:putative disease resistance RPP13-like protein 3 [Carex rostrata]
MAEAVVQFVVEKLANLMANELKHLGGVGGKVQMMQKELIRIQSCLKDADTKHKGDARVQNWLNELRDVAYRIEDATDTFLVEVEDRRVKHLNKINKMFHKTIKVKTLHKLGTDLDNIQNELDRISKSRDDYGIVAVQDIVGEETILPFRRETYQEVDDTDVVGMETDKKNILQLMLPEKTPRRAVITIVGPGGLGKTTLAHIVYRSAKEKFEYHIMLSISQQYSLIDLVTKMLLKLGKSIPENQGLGDLISTLKSFLNDRRYLIVLDDVWKEDLWIQLKDILPDVNNGSRVLMTSRNLDVAKSTDSQIPPYELYFLDSKKSLDLLLKKALPNQKPDKECPSNLLELANQLSKKCKGLPLALIVLGGVLLKKRGDYLEWERVLRTFDWNSDCKSCMDVLAMSYQDMPYYLKACFMYLAFFPEDYEISATDLIRMWIAEGFIPCKETTTKEEMAERYLDELFERSMIQVSRRSTYGLIKSFTVHDLLRDLAIHEARQQNFLTVFAQASDVNQPNREIRRASLQYHVQPQQKNPQFMEYLGSNTRSLLLFGLGYFTVTQMPKFSNFRLLKVLHLVDVNNDGGDHLAKEFEKLIHLKYLRFRRCHINSSSFSVHRMKTLETLDFRKTKIENPNLSWTSSTLRHVRCDQYNLELANSTVDLRNLQTLKWVSIRRSLDTKLILLNNLRKLGVCVYEDWAGMTNLLGKMPSLVSLAIKRCKFSMDIPMEIVYPKALPNYQNLRSLYLHGPWVERPETATTNASLFPPRLIKLTLCWCDFRQNPMPELGKLKNLKKLSLQHVMEIHSKVSAICSKGFPVLQYLEVHDSRLGDLVVEKGVMPMLTYLQIYPSVKLQLPPELQHVTVQES